MNEQQLNRIYEMIIELRQSVEEFISYFEENREENQKRFEQINKRFEQIDSRFHQIDKRFEQIDSRFDRMDNRFDEVFTGPRQTFDNRSYCLQQR